MLSQNDRTLLQLIQKNATLSTKDLAERARMSAATVWRRLKDFEALGLIKDRVALLDPEKLGLSVCMMVSVNIRDQTAKARADFERFAEITDTIQTCYAVTGASDYVLMVRTASVADFESLLMEHILAHPSVASAQSQLVLRTAKNSTVLPV